jgi:transposase
MQVLYAHCAGLDVHKRTVVACVMKTAPNGAVESQTNTFATDTAALLALSDWLRGHGVTHAVMESTGVYWKPVYNLLEGQCELLLANAQHVKALPGRKTDVKDAEWLADLLRHGLLRGSYVPARPQRELRELTRHRGNLVERRAQAINELHKCLESTNLKLGDVVSDIMGVSAREMLAQLLAGQSDPKLLAELARGRLKQKKPLLEKALVGTVQPHHRLILSQLLADIDWCEEQVAEVGLEIAARLAAHEELLARLDEIPGINRRIAQVLLAEVGTDVKPFPSDKHLVSWAGMCAGNNQSGGKRRRGRTRPGNRHLKAALMEAAHAAGRKKGSYLKAKYRRLSGRRGKKRDKVAVVRTILQSIYLMIQRGTAYEDMG